MNKRTEFFLIHAIVVVITLACILMNGPMRAGLPVDTTLAERMSYIAQNSLMWSLSWCVWMLSAIGLLTFCTIYQRQLKPSLGASLGLTLVALGIAPDLSAEVLYAFVLPAWIEQGQPAASVEALETVASLLTGFLGNGLYNLGAMLLTIMAIREGLLRAWQAIWAMLAWTLGLLLSVAVAFGHMPAAEIFTATSMVLSTLWMLVFAYQVLPKQRPL